MISLKEKSMADPLLKVDHVTQISYNVAKRTDSSGCQF